MSERCPICDEEECHHTPDEKELVKRRAEVIVLEKAIDGWRSVNRSLSSKLSAAEKERDDLKKKDEELVRVLDELLGSGNKANPHLGVAAAASLLVSERDSLKAKLAVAVEALKSIESGSVYLDNGKGKTPKTRAREALKAIGGE